MDYILGIKRVKKKMPNCAICKWCKEIDYAIIGRRMICRGQGMKDCSEVYKNNNCKGIYEENINEQ